MPVLKDHTTVPLIPRWFDVSAIIREQLVLDNWLSKTLFFRNYIMNSLIYDDFNNVARVFCGSSYIF